MLDGRKVQTASFQVTMLAMPLLVLCRTFSETSIDRCLRSQPAKDHLTAGALPLVAVVVVFFDFFHVPVHTIAARLTTHRERCNSKRGVFEGWLSHQSREAETDVPMRLASPCSNRVNALHGVRSSGLGCSLTTNIGKTAPRECRPACVEELDIRGSRMQIRDPVD